MRILRACFLLALIVGSPGAAVAQNSSSSDTQPVMSLVISAVQNPVKAGAPVRVEMALTNKSDHDVTFSRPGDGYDCRLDVRDVNEKLVADTKFSYLRFGNGDEANPDKFPVSPDDLKGAVIVFVTVKPGDTLTWVEDATRLHEMSQPGEYTIQGQAPEPGDLSVRLKSNTITVTVIP